jgi:putative transposase
MPYRKDVFAEGNYYHVFNRGVNKEPIFFNVGNYEYCVHLLKKYLDEYAVTMIAFCLMPNHYHLLLRQNGSKPPSSYINIVFNAFVQAVNKQQERVGALFGSRFKHSWIDREEYLIHLCRYIHLNPVKAGLVSRPEDWAYSDYSEWIGGRIKSFSVNVFFDEQFGSPEVYRRFVMDMQNEDIAQEHLKGYTWDKIVR